jgi:ankyrin repeat protein
LLGAAITPSKETVQLLLAKANLHATDWSGNTALDWAARRGETDIVRNLREAGAEQAKPSSRPSKPLALQQPPGRRFGAARRIRSLAPVATKRADDHSDPRLRHLSPARSGVDDRGPGPQAWVHR